MIYYLARSFKLQPGILKKTIKKLNKFLLGTANENPTKYT